MTIKKEVQAITSDAILSCYQLPKWPPHGNGPESLIYLNKVRYVSGIMATKSNKIKTLSTVALSMALASGMGHHLRAQEVDAAVNNGKVTLTATPDRPTVAVSSTNPPAPDLTLATNKSEFYSKDGGYVIPLKVSGDSAVQQYGDDSEQQTIQDLIKTNSAEGKWTLIVTRVNRFVHPDSGLESYALLPGRNPCLCECRLDAQA